MSHYDGPLNVTHSQRTEHVQAFINSMIERGELSYDTRAACYTAYLLGYYEEWCVQTGRYVLSDKMVGTILAELGYPALRGGGGRRMRGGLRLRCAQLNYPANGPRPPHPEITDAY